ncbi:MAG: sulfatase-like hydrolase/transferase [Bacteroidales bacterium]|nr:sulfatase-like hydrolase/transferase [Bacteroidales bacterium]
MPKKTLQRQIIISFLKQFLFWLVIFNILRVIFSFYNINFLKGVTFIEYIGVFWHSLPLDISAICYIMGLPFIILIIQSFYQTRWIEILNKIYVFIVLFLVIFIAIAESGVYGEWKTKLHYKALMYLINPKEIIGTAQTWQLIVFAIALPVQQILFYLLYLKVFYKKIQATTKNHLFSFLFIILMPGLLFLGLRGGAKQIPINQSQSYYSHHEILNNISVNSLWNLGRSIIDNYNLIHKNPYEYFKLSEACEEVDKMFNVASDSIIKILNTNRPNIVFFILEGWSADLIESLGGEKGITPFFHELEHDGVLFTNIYSSGTRSQEGMAAIFSGFPAQTITTITSQPEKYNKLPSLNKSIKQEGYFSSFYFGGQLIYGNIKSYMMYNNFDRIIEEEDLPSNLPRGKLGVHDEYTFPYFLKEINRQKPPFITCIFTLSTHSPYDCNMPENFTWPEFEKKYVNAAFYADNCLKNFFILAKKQPWYENTLFVLISDHSHSSYRNHSYYSPDYHKIVLMFCGDVIKEEYKGTIISKTGSQTDLAKTLLTQLAIPSDSFSWSKNLLNPASNEFAFYAFNNGFGFVRKGAEICYDANLEKTVLLKIDSVSVYTESELLKQAKSYMQCSFQQYMDF